MASTFCDIDDIFAYQTPKVVVVRDRYLGLLKLFFLAGIIAYVLVTLLTSDPPGYVTTAAPVGLISKLTLQRPPNRVFDSRNMTYCSDYLNTTGQGPSQYRDQCECLVWDEGDAQFPIDLPNALFVTTRATIGQQERLCGVKATHNCANPWSNRADSNPPPSYYTLGVDEFTVLVQHSFRGGPWDPAGMSSLRMDGSLTAANGTVVKQFPYDPSNLVRRFRAFGIIMPSRHEFVCF